MDELHVWVGSFEGSLETFEKFFDLTDFYNNYESGNNFERCEFCKYIDDDSYDNDFIGFEIGNIGIKELLFNTLPDSDLAEKVLRKCEEENILKPNAILYYGDEDLSVNDLDDNFKGLKYLGVFDWD
ncbi:immunity 22 family protein [Tenacibaculum sp. ZH5_bin.1]|uniref:immunity 22 family protein n=1 Tax=Tenacibaculum TaxID=104267 RepID=UPI001431B8F2|nr:immunity 22 family protein [Tenacibaculum mesophilum]KAF9659530.1 immunity 22 family protein [Tenacibaculum mesophilum]